MKTHYVVALSLVGGAALGAGVVQGLHAQAKPPVFQITLQDVRDLDALNKEFVPQARAAVRQYGGHPLASGVPVSIEGAPPKGRVVINQWSSIEQLRQWYNSPEYQKAREIGNKYATFQIFAVEGIPQP